MSSISKGNKVKAISNNEKCNTCKVIITKALGTKYSILPE